MLQARPGAFARLGQGGAEGGCFLHNSQYDFNDGVIPLGAGYLAALAERAMPLDDRSARRRSPGGASAVLAEATQRSAGAWRERSISAAALRVRRMRRRASEFLAAARARGLAVESHVHPAARGAEGEELAVDVALLGIAERAASLLCLTVRHARRRRLLRLGRARSALLRDDGIRRRRARRRASRSLLCHAINPYGFSHLRRTNEDNVDLNRNFRDFAAPRAPNDAYAEVHDFIVPRDVAAGCRERGAASERTSRRAASPRCRRRSPAANAITRTACSTAACGRRGATTCCARVLREHGRERAAPGVDRRSYRTRARTGTARRSSSGPDDAADDGARAARGGAPTSRRSTTARRRRRR